MEKKRKFSVVSRFPKEINRMVFETLKAKGFPPCEIIPRLLKIRNRLFEQNGLARWTWWPATVYCTLPAGHKWRFTNTVRVVIDAACPFVPEIDQDRFRVGFFVVLPEVLEFAGGAWRLIRAGHDPDVRSIVVSLIFPNVQQKPGDDGGLLHQGSHFSPSKSLRLVLSHLPLSP